MTYIQIAMNKSQYALWVIYGCTTVSKSMTRVCTPMGVDNNGNENKLKHLLVLFQAQSTSALSQQDVNVSSLKACWDALYPEKSNSGYLTLVTSSFPSAKASFINSIAIFEISGLSYHKDSK